MKAIKILTDISIIITWPLISFGALVRLHGAGLACPDWPLCYGQLIPPPGFEIAMEVGHRLVATILGIIIILLLVCCYKDKSIPRKFVNYSWVTLGLVIFQGVLGGLTVIYGLHPLTVILHLLFGNGLLFFLVWMRHKIVAAKTNREQFFYKPKKRAEFDNKVLIALCSIFVVILISGGLNSSTYSGYSCRAFPLCLPGESLSFYVDVQTAERDSSDFPGMLEGEDGYDTNEYIHMIHRVIAIFGGLAMMYLCFIFLNKRLSLVDKKLALAIISLISLEFVIGIVNALYLVPIPISSAHTAIAATIVMILALLFSRNYQR